MKKMQNKTNKKPSERDYKKPSERERNYEKKSDMYKRVKKTAKQFNAATDSTVGRLYSAISSLGR